MQRILIFYFIESTTKRKLLTLSLAEEDHSGKYSRSRTSEIIPLSKITKRKFEFDSRIRSRLWQQGS